LKEEAVKSKDPKKKKVSEKLTADLTPAIQDGQASLKDRDNKEKKESSSWVYGLSMALVLMLLVIGVTKLNDYGRMSAIQTALDKLVSSKEDEVVNNKDIPVIGEVISSEDVGGQDITDPPKNEEVVTPEPEVPEPEVPESVTPEPVTPQPENPIVNTLAYGDGVYVVEKGDTLAIISRKVYGDLKHIEAIRSMNGLKDGNLILVGQKLVLP
jgi:nucleoid-associated protein YgaU